MKIATIINELETNGVKLKLNGDKLTIDAPKGILKSETRELLSRNKTEIIKLLSGNVSAHKNSDIFTDEDFMYLYVNTPERFLSYLIQFTQRSMKG